MSQNGIHPTTGNGRTPAPPVKLDGVHHRVLETARNRVLVSGIVFAVAFMLIAARLVELSVFGPASDPGYVALSAPDRTPNRGDILDRNGVLLATSLPTASLYVDPSEVLDPEDAARRLTGVLPELDAQRVLAKLTARSRFEWLHRNLTPTEQYAVNELGIPGFGFVHEQRRLYPHGRAAAHVLGFTDIDGRGIAGVERSFDETLTAGEDLRVAIDIRVQDLLREELAAAVTEFQAIGAAGLVADVRTGEVLAMVSLPDFDANAPASAPSDARFNRAAMGVYEMGSTFKLFTAAMAVDSGTATLEDRYDARQPLRVARYTIRDYRPEARWLTVPEVVIHSSNIGAAKIALDVGGETQRDYLGRLGLLTPAAIELPEVGSPLVPQRWREVTTMTVAFGHGVAVSPVQLTQAVAAVAGGGILRPATLLTAPATGAPGERVLSAESSEAVRTLMRLVVRRGTGRKAEVPGYRIGGKTGTAEKLVDGRYRDGAVVASFVGAFPIDDPRYVVLAVFDEPKGTAETLHHATGGWIAAPVVGRVVRQMAPLMGLAPTGIDRNDGPVRRPIERRSKPFFIAVKEAIADARGRRLASY